ncbi:aspartate--tRNA(Asn) ligase, partial [Candidatus Microgenomates bacterium]|nr:aspartate--tRNA(Asn) ligase [Candidatus Microgenomates bacterium]
RRDHGKLIFIDLRDRSGIIQIVVKESQQLRLEDVIEVAGVVNKRPAKMVNKNLPTGEVEVAAKTINVLSKAETLPFDMGTEALSLELPTLLDWRSLTLRHLKIKGIFAVQAQIMENFRKLAKELGCTEIVVPTIVSGATEGGAELFAIDYYDKTAYLSQSPQLYKQMMVPIFERVWTIAKAYRAEPSVTTRHLTETTQMDCELGFVEFTELLDILEEMAIKMVKDIKADDKVAIGKIPRLTLKEAQRIINVQEDKDLSPQDEVDICSWAKGKHGSDFVTITHFPTLAKPFYTMPDPKNPQSSLSYDLLFRGVEILSGSQRINDYEKLVKNIKERGMNPDNFELYLQAFRYGMPPEGGFSFGLERLTMKLLNLANIREASLFPRDMERVDVRLSSHEKKNSKETGRH